ncbi:MAG: hypothetical protein GYA15_16030 [Leptolinea sp.]|jgi:hypothetical protein|nr:hypothetical protein [Leptolinea sp.]
MKYSKFSFLSIVAIITLLTLALGSFIHPVYAAESDPNKPGDIPTRYTQTVHDQTDEKTASEKQANGGDVFGLGWYERPFDKDMTYMPYIDLSKALMNREDANWVYLQIFVVNPIEEGASAKPLFGVELDTDLDNRGEYLLTATTSRSTEWSTEGVVILNNSDNMMGGLKPVLPDTNLSDSKGYDKEIFNAGTGDDPNLAWARISPSDPKVMDIAIKSSFLGGAKGKFIWFVWTLAGVQDMSKLEFNDHILRVDAGSPLKGEKDLYPLKALWGVDNTSRIPSGFVPTGMMPGLPQDFQPKP